MIMSENYDDKVLIVPYLRFHEFSGEWKKVRLGDNCNIQMCKRIMAAQTNTDRGVPFFKIGTIGGKADAYISKELFDEYKAKYPFPHKGEVMITCAGTVGKCIIYNGKDSYYQDSNIVWIDNPNEIISNDFLYHLLCKVNWSHLNSTTIVRIYNDDLRNLKLYIPQHDEQKKITHLLSLINERIATQNKIIEDLKKLKSVISQIIFRNSTLVKIQNLCEVIMGQSPSSSSYNSNNDGLPLIQGNLDILDGITISRIYTNEPTKISLPKDLILTVRAPVGIVAENKMKVCIGRGVCALRNKSAMPTMYIYYALDYFSYKWKQIEQGSTFTSINGDDVKNFTIPLVDDVEYSCALLSKVDVLIKCSIDLHSNYIKQKQYLLSQLFI